MDLAFRSGRAPRDVMITNTWDTDWPFGVIDRRLVLQTRWPHNPAVSQTAGTKPSHSGREFRPAQKPNRTTPAPVRETKQPTANYRHLHPSPIYTTVPNGKIPTLKPRYNESQWTGCIMVSVVYCGAPSTHVLRHWEVENEWRYVVIGYVTLGFDFAWNIL